MVENPQKRVRNHSRAAERDVSKKNDRVVSDIETFPRGDTYNVVFVKNTRMQKCYGCGGVVRHKLSDDIPAPWDIVLTRREFRVFSPRGTTTIRISKSKENVYYHPRLACLKKKNAVVGSEDILVTPEVAEKLSQLHKVLLANEFGKRFN